MTARLRCGGSPEPALGSMSWRVEELGGGGGGCKLRGVGGGRTGVGRG